MARGLNKVMLIGNLGDDPEIRFLPDGTPVGKLSIATSEQWKDKTTGQKQEKTTWHRVILWSRLAEVAGEYLRKGSKVYIEGSIQFREFPGDDGKPVRLMEIKAKELQMLDSRQDRQPYQAPQNAPQAPQQQGNANTQGMPAPGQGQAAAQPGAGNPPNPGNPGGFNEFFDDDIPF